MNQTALMKPAASDFWKSFKTPTTAVDAAGRLTFRRLWETVNRRVQTPEIKTK